VTHINIRLAVKDDAKGIAKVHVETWQYAYINQIPDTYLNNLSIEGKTNAWKKNLESSYSKTKTFIAEISNQIVGFASAGPGRDDDLDNVGEILAIYVDKNYMNKGIGTSLQNACFEYLKSLNYKKATLWVLLTNNNSRRWYEYKGWKIEGKTKIDKRDTFTLDEIRYAINL
jgi:ribosomal protein S18 acetylase RimI-like enzyme